MPDERKHRLFMFEPEEDAPKRTWMWSCRCGAALRRQASAAEAADSYGEHVERATRSG